METWKWRYGDIDMIHGNMAIWRRGDMKTWRHGEMETNMETWTWRHRHEI